MAGANPSSRAPAPDIPVEILLKIFDDLPLPDLVRGSHVSRNWRRAARSHSVYWSDINFTANDIVDSELWLLSSRLRFVSARLAAAPEGRTVNLSLGTSINCYCLYGTAGSDCVGDFCRGPLRKYIPVIQRLVVNYSDIVLGAVVDALSAGSTKLQFLELSAGFNLLGNNSSVRLIRRIVSFLRRTFQPHTESYLDVHPQSFYPDRQAIPANLHSLMPNLHTLRLKYVTLPDTPGQVFPTIERLWLDACHGVPLESLVARFPRLRHLALERREDGSTFLAVTASNTQWLTSLKSIGVDEELMLTQILLEHNVRVPNIVSLASGSKRNRIFQVIRRLVLRAWTGDNVAPLTLSVTPFHEDLGLPAHRGDTACLNITDTRTGHVFGLRVFTLDGQLRDYLGQPRPISLQQLGLHDVASHFVSLCLPVAVVPHFIMERGECLNLPNLSRLDIEVGGKMGNFGQVQTSTIPEGQLQQLEEVRFIRSSWLQQDAGMPEVVVDPSLLADLLQQILREPRLAVIVRFEGVRFEGHDSLPEDLTFNELVSRYGTP